MKNVSAEYSDMKTIQVGPVSIGYLETGYGPGVLLAHCSSASHKQWNFIVHELRTSRRVVAPDLIGYGSSDSWPTSDSMPYDSDVLVLERLLHQVQGPVDLVGHSYGAAMCLEVARRDAETGGKIIRSLTLIEPVSFHLLSRNEGGRAWRTINSVAMGCMEQVRAGMHEKAADLYMGYWLGKIRWWLAPKRFKLSVVKTVSKVADEFRGIYDHSCRPSDYAGIGCNVTLVRGSKTRLAASAVVDILADNISNVSVVDIQGAGHMSPFTHPNEVREVILSGIA